MSNFLTYMYLLTPLHTGGSADEGNLMGIAREVHTEFPYLPSSSLRGRIRAAMEKSDAAKLEAPDFFGQKIDNGEITEGKVWFADATLLFFPIASLSHHVLWVTCPLWLERWARWLGKEASDVLSLADVCREKLSEKSAVTSFSPDRIYLQSALLKPNDIDSTVSFATVTKHFKSVLGSGGLISQLEKRMLVLSEEDCISLVETGLQREVRVALNENEKTVKGGSFRSEEAIPPEAVLFFPWGTKPTRALRTSSSAQPTEVEAAKNKHEAAIRGAQVVETALLSTLGDRLQFGGLEGLGRGWTMLKTDVVKSAGA